MPAFRTVSVNGLHQKNSIMEGLLVIFSFLGYILVIIAFYLFVRMANDLHFLRKEFEKLKRIHRLGEYHLVKGERIYRPGEKLYCKELDSVVIIMELADNGLYYCESTTSQGTYYGKTYYIAGDKLSELPKKES